MVSATSLLESEFCPSLGLGRIVEGASELVFDAKLLDVLGLLGHKAFVVDGLGSVVSTAAPADAVGHLLGRPASSDVVVPLPNLHRIVTRCIASGEPAATLVKIGEAWAKVVVLPFKKRDIAHQIRAQSPACLVIHEADVVSEASGVGKLSTTFNLTVVESNLVAMVCGGATTKGAAARMGISYNTARKYMSRIFEKVGVRRQTELVALMIGNGRS